MHGSFTFLSIYCLNSQHYGTSFPMLNYATLVTSSEMLPDPLECQNTVFLTSLVQLGNISEILMLMSSTSQLRDPTTLPAGIACHSVPIRLPLLGLQHPSNLPDVIFMLQ